MSISERKIIIFDDDEDIVSICQFVLMEQGWKVYSFADCNDPVTKVESIMPDVILMDNWIPNEGGIVTSQKIKESEHVKHIPIVFFSASGNIKALAAEAGADAYLSKPFDLDALEKILGDRLEARNI